MSINSIKEELKKYEGYETLNAQDQKLIKYNFLSFIGHLNIVIDKKIWEEHPTFPGDFLQDTIGLRSYAKTELSKHMNSKKPFANFKDTKYNYLEYHDTVRLINFVTEDFGRLYEEEEMPLLNPSAPDEEHKTIILLYNHQDKTNQIIEEFIRGLYKDDSFIFIVDEEYPEIAGLGAEVRLLKFEYDRSEINEAVEYLEDEASINRVADKVKADIEEKIKNRKETSANKINIEEKPENDIDFSLKKNEFEKTLKKIVKERKRLYNLSVDSKHESLKDITRYMDDDLQVDTIIRRIEKDYVEKNKKNQREFAEKYLEAKVSNVNNTIKWKVKQFNKETENSLKDISISYNHMAGLKVENNISSWFASGLLGLGSYGALALYMSSLGNLGGYILVAKGVSALSALGISVGGTAAAIKGISILGGPVGIAIGAGLATMLISKSLLGIGWKKSLAKQIRKTSINKVVPELNSNVRTLWDDTGKAVKEGFDSIIKESAEDFINTYEDSLTPAQKRDIENQAKKALSDV